jgi:hypothetical protein
MQPNELPNYETQQQQQEHPHPDYSEHKLGSMRKDTDALDAVAGTGPAGMPAEFVAPERRPVEALPREVLPIATQPTDFMTPERRPVEFRPREIILDDGR